MYLGSSLGSSLHIYDEADITVIVTDPDGDELHATVTMYGKPHEDCNWPQCNSKTIHATAEANPDGESRAEITFSNWWRLPGRYIVRVTSLTTAVGSRSWTSHSCSTSLATPTRPHRESIAPPQPGPPPHAPHAPRPTLRESPPLPPTRTALPRRCCRYIVEAPFIYQFKIVHQRQFDPEPASPVRVAVRLRPLTPPFPTNT